MALVQPRCYNPEARSFAVSTMRSRYAWRTICIRYSAQPQLEAERPAFWLLRRVVSTASAVASWRPLRSAPGAVSKVPELSHRIPLPIDQSTATDLPTQSVNVGDSTEWVLRVQCFTSTRPNRLQRACSPMLQHRYPLITASAASSSPERTESSSFVAFYTGVLTSMRLS